MVAMKRKNGQSTLDSFVVKRPRATTDNVDVLLNQASLHADFHGLDVANNELLSAFSTVVTPAAQKFMTPSIATPAFSIHNTFLLLFKALRNERKSLPGPMADLAQRELPEQLADCLIAAMPGGLIEVMSAGRPWILEELRDSCYRSRKCNKTDCGIYAGLLKSAVRHLYVGKTEVTFMARTNQHIASKNAGHEKFFYNVWRESGASVDWFWLAHLNRQRVLSLTTTHFFYFEFALMATLNAFTDSALTTARLEKWCRLVPDPLLRMLSGGKMVPDSALGKIQQMREALKYRGTNVSIPLCEDRSEFNLAYGATGVWQSATLTQTKRGKKTTRVFQLCVGAIRVNLYENEIAALENTGIVIPLKKSVMYLLQVEIAQGPVPHPQRFAPEVPISTRHEDAHLLGIKAIFQTVDNRDAGI
ncbi:hypothetical protein NA57DRAFT_70278 [Rhizodiscina lignyota]|uniref:Uncharacterized protein n=1 Tax=Rhizodiscina lignyota TaxID=1504668 RepID=A0A9P4MAV5_9PEZI|nr:hypothetical protein NA57DRAFT_70278 [Rhizodiscina lignyota]